MALKSLTMPLQLGGPALAGCLLLAGAAFAETPCSTRYDEARKTRSEAASSAAASECGALAKRGDPLGQLNLGLLKLDGIGMPQDVAGGVELVRAAADAGLAAAQTRLGRMHLRGDGVAADLGTAAEWFERAANGGDPLAQYELGQLRYTGLGIARDNYEAYRWFSAAAANFARLGNEPRRKLAERKQASAAAQLPAEERARADRWVAEQLAR
ncbi:MAG TPA: tetratricopeptide repeat protein [Gammaproteobacteria bacterium]